MAKAPDFSRHPQVSQEQQVGEPKILIKLKEDSFDKAYHEENAVISEKPLWIDLYLKVGLYCGWSWQEFKETPYPVIKYINSEIDRRVKNCMKPGSIFSWMQFSIMTAVARAFGAKDSDD